MSALKEVGICTEPHQFFTPHSFDAILKIELNFSAFTVFLCPNMSNSWKKNMINIISLINKQIWEKAASLLELSCNIDHDLPPSQSNKTCQLLIYLIIMFYY